MIVLNSRLLSRNADIKALASAAATIALLISVCAPDKKFSCNAANQTCLYYGKNLQDWSDPTGCCWWWQTNCLKVIQSPPSGGGGNGQSVPRPPNSNNGPHKKE